MLCSLPGLFATPLAFSVAILTPDLARQMMATIANRSNAGQIWVVGDIVACQPKGSLGAGTTLEGRDIGPMLAPFYDLETTHAFLCALEEGRLVGCSFDSTERAFTRGSALPDRFEAPMEQTLPPPKRQKKVKPRSKKLPEATAEPELKPVPELQPEPEPQPEPALQPEPEPQPVPEPDSPSQPSPMPPAPPPVQPEPPTEPVVSTSPAFLSEEEARIVADLYSPGKDAAASLFRGIFAITQPKLPLDMLPKIEKRHFDRAVFLALGARQPQDGQEIYLMAGMHFTSGHYIQDCLFVAETRPVKYSNVNYPKVRLRYHQGEWVILNNACSGKGATALVYAILTLTDWGLKHNGRPFRSNSKQYPLSQEKQAIREAVLALQDKAVTLGK